MRTAGLWPTSSNNEMKSFLIFLLFSLQCSSGKYDLLQHSKGDKTSRQYTVLKDAVQEIIKGPETPRGSQGQKSWSRRLHQIFFCKSFIFNTHCASKEETEYATKVMQSAKALCQPIPDFHPHLYFELLDEFQWCEFLGEVSVHQSAHSFD